MFEHSILGPSGGCLLRKAASTSFHESGLLGHRVDLAPATNSLMPLATAPPSYWRLPSIVRLGSSSAARWRYEDSVDWSELRVVQWIARQTGARASFVVPDSALGEPTRYG